MSCSYYSFKWIISKVLLSRSKKKSLLCKSSPFPVSNFTTSCTSTEAAKAGLVGGFPIKISAPLSGICELPINSFQPLSPGRIVVTYPEKPPIAALTIGILSRDAVSWIISRLGIWSTQSTTIFVPERSTPAPMTAIVARKKAIWAWIPKVPMFRWYFNGIIPAFRASSSIF